MWGFFISRGVETYAVWGTAVKPYHWHVNNELFKLLRPEKLWFLNPPNWLYMALGGHFYPTRSWCIRLLAWIAPAVGIEPLTPKPCSTGCASHRTTQIWVVLDCCVLTLMFVCACVSCVCHGCVVCACSELSHVWGRGKGVCGQGLSHILSVGSGNSGLFKGAAGVTGDGFQAPVTQCQEFAT